MATCSHKAPNGEKSLLYQKLEEIYGPAIASQLWDTVHSQQFLNKHGDWITGVGQVPDFKGQMTFDYGSNRRPGLSAETTIQAIRMGERTATTRYESDGKIDYWKQAKVGDIIEFSGKNGEKVKVVVTKELHKIANIDPEVWSKKEGWSIDYFNTKVRPKLKKAWQIEYKLLSPVPLDINGEPTYEWVKEKLELQEPTISQREEITYNEFEPDKRGVRISDEAMDEKVQILYTTAAANPDKIYVIPYTNLGDRRTYNSGFTSKELANIFDRYPIPENVRFNANFYTLIQNSSKRIIAEMGNNRPVELMQQGDAIDHMLNILIPKSGPDGRSVGYFTPGEQQEVIDSLIYFTQSILLADPNAKANALIKSIYAMYQKAKQLEQQGGNEILKENLMYIYRQRIRFADATLSQMEGLGLSTDAQTRARILNAVDGLRPLGEIEKKQIEELKPGSLEEMFDPETGEFLEAAGRGLTDWGDITFELDPKDTASARMKMFIATLPDMDRGVYRASPDAEVVIDLSTKVKDKTLEQLLARNKPATAFTIWNQEDPLSVQKIVRNANRRTLWIKDEKTSAALVSFLSQQYPLVAKDNFLGMRKLVDYEATFQDILETLADAKQDLNTYLSTLLGSGKPNMEYLVQALRKADRSVQNEFAKVMSKQYQQFTMILFNEITDKDGNTSFTLNSINANRYNQKNTIIKNWQQSQKLSEIMIINKNGDRTIDVERIKKEWLPVLERAGSILDWNAENTNWAKKEMANIFNLSGVNMTSDMMDYLFNNIEKITKKQKFPGGLLRQFSITKEGKPNGMFSAFILKAAGITDVEAGEELGDIESANRAEIHNPLYTEKSTMTILAGVAAKFTPVLHSSNHRSSEGKNIWDYGLNTKLSHKMRELLTDFDTVKSRLDQIDFSKGNWLMKAISDQPAILNNIKLGYLDGIKPTWGKKGTTRQGMSDREQMLMSISLFQTQGMGFNKVPRVGYLSLTHSDKTTTPVFSGMPKINTGVAGDYSTLIGIGTPLYNIFRNEYERIIKQRSIDYNDARYNKGKGLFYMIPDFNYDAMKEMVERGELTPAEFKLIWLNGTRELTQHINSDRELPVINKILIRFANNLVADTTREWIDNGIINPDTYTTLFDKKYTQKALYQNGITSGSIAGSTVYKNSTNKIITAQEVWDVLTTTAAKDYAINHFLFNTALSQIFYGDPAQTYKGKEGANDIAKVEATMQEYAKRLAKDIAPGQDLYWEEHQRKYTTITMADVKVSEDYLAGYENLREAYAAVTNKDSGGPVEGTDAQELTTTQEHIDTFYAGGLITSKVYNEMSDIIKNARRGYYEFTIPEHLEVIMQPQKPVYAGTREILNGAQLDDYIKSSSYPLYPPLTVGTEMDKLRKLMENENVQRANFESAKKIGSPNKPVKVFTKDGKFIQPTSEDLKGATQVLDRSGFRIQQEVPYDEEKEAIKTVTQENKLIVEGITTMDTTFRVGEHLMSGKEVRNYKEAVRSAMIKKNRQAFLDKFAIDPDSVNYNIGNKNKVYDLLTEEARKKGYTLNELQSLLIRDREGELEIPLIFNTAADRLESMLMSMVRKIAEVKMPGKSYIQAASVGYTFTREGDIDMSKVAWLGSYDGSPLKTLRRDGAVMPAQVLIPFNYFAKDGTKLNLEDFTIKLDNGRTIIDEDKFPLELLQMIGARIPNQGHNSMLPIEVVGFIPANMGDLIIVPSAITKQMGADFDVDKLYTYKRGYTHDPETGVLSLLSVPNEINEANMDQLKEAYFNIHWGILTNRDMIEKVLRPLDKPDLEEENKRLAKPRVGSSYYNVMSQLRDFQSGKEAKMLVGSTSLSVTFNAVIQDKNLYLFDYDYTTDGDGNTVRVEKAVFIEVKDEHTGEILPLGRLSGNGISNYTVKDGGPIDPSTRRTKHDNHTTMQSAAVDNAKNRTLDNLNLTRNTYRAAAAFTQLETFSGQAVNLKYITRLLTQPIIKEFDHRMKIGNDSLSDSFTKDLKAKTIQDLELEYVRKIQKGDGQEQEILERARAIRFDPQTLLKAQSMPIDSEAFILHQLAALNLFQKLDVVGKRLSELQAQFNQDTNGAGPNLLSSLDKEEKMDSLEQVPIAGAVEIFQSDTGTLTEQGTIFDSTVHMANKVLTQLLPYSSFQTIFNTIGMWGNKTGLTIDQQRAIIRGYRSFTYTSGTQWWEDTQAERIRLYYGENSLAKRVVEAKRTWGKDNYFLQRLDSAIGNSKESPDYLEYQAVSTGRIDEEQNNRGWLSMLVSNSEQERRLGEDLIRYAYLTGGIQDANSFVKYIPISYIAGTNFGQMLKDRIMDLTKDSDEIEQLNIGFMNQYFQHNPDLATQVNKEQLDRLTEEYSGAEPTTDYPEVFKFPTIGAGTFSELGMDNYLMDDPDHGAQPVPFISYRSKSEGKWILYSRQIQEDGTYYIRIDTLGNQYTDEYNGLIDTSQRSIFTENRAMAERVVNGDLNGLFNIEQRMYADMNAGGVSAFNQLGINEGGAEAIANGIRTIQNDEALPEYLRTTAKVLSMSNTSIREVQKAMEALNIRQYKPTIEFDNTIDTAGLSYPNGRIVLNAGIKYTSDKTGAAAVFLHEVTHNKLQLLIAASGFDDEVNRRIGELDYAKAKPILDKMNEFAKENSRVMDSIRELDKVRFIALNTLMKQLGDDRIRTIFQDIEAGNLATKEHRLVYGVYNIQELTAHVMTDTDVAKFLGTLQDTSGNLLSRIWNSITRVFKSFAEALGFKVKDDSLFTTAITNTLQLLNISDRHVNVAEALMNGEAIRVSSETEGNTITEIIRENYSRGSKMTGDEMGYTIQVTNRKPINKDPQIEKILGKLSAQLREAGYNISKAKTREDRVQAAIRYRSISDDIAILKRTQSLKDAVVIATKQLAWVDKVLATPSAPAAKVYAALSVANMWSNIIDLIYGDLQSVGEIDPAFSELQAKAQARRIRLVNEKSREVVMDALNNRIVLKPADFTQIDELHVAESNLLALNRVKPILAQGIAIIGRQAANNRDEEIFRVTKKLDAIKAQMKKHNIKNDAFLEPGHWALATRLKRTWYDALSDTRKSLEKQLESADTTTGISDESRRRLKNDTWKEYWTAMNSFAIFVDTRAFFNFEDGTRKEGKEVDAAKAKLIKAVGFEGYANELIDQAYELYQDYLQERDIAKDYFETSITLNEEEAADKTTEEQDVLLAEKKKTAYEHWLSYNSPNEFLGKSSGKSSRANAGDRWLVKAPTRADFYSDQYAKIQDSDVLRPIYEQYREIIQEMVSYLPATEREKINEDFLPIVSNDMVTSLADMFTKVKNWDATLMNTFTATEAEEYARLRPNEIPIMYTYPTKKMKDDPESQNKDVLRVTEVFAMMALHYKNLAPVLDQINVAESIIQEVNRQRVNKETPGKPLEQLQKSVAYFKDALVFKKPRLLEGRIDNPIYSLNVAKQLKAQNKVKELYTEKKTIEKQMEDQWNEGNFDTPELDERLDEINEQLDTYAKMARNIYGSKVTDTLISVNQMKALGYNPFSAISNFTFGLVSTFIHASGRRDYDLKAARKAMGIMMNSVQKYYTFGTIDNPQARKIMNLMDRLGVIGEIVDTQIGGSNLRDRNKGWKSALAPFNWQKSGDYFAKGMVMVAMLMKKQVEVEQEGVKKDISLWDALDEEGKWNEAKYGQRPEWYSEEPSEQTEWNNYRDRIRKVGTLVFGNQDKNAPLLARKNWLFRLAGQFRMSWLPEGVASRWMAERFDIELGRKVKGRWRSAPDLGWFTSAGLMVKQLLAQLPGIKIDPFEGVVDKKGDPISELDMENMRKNFSGLAFTIAFLASILIIRGFYEDDKRRGKKKSANALQRQLLLNMLIRNHQDLMLYASPDVMDTVTGNLLPATAVVSDAWKAMKATTHYMLGNTEDEKDAMDKWISKVARAFPIANLYPKTKYMMKRDLDAISR